MAVCSTNRERRSFWVPHWWVFANKCSIQQRPAASPSSNILKSCVGFERDAKRELNLLRANYGSLNFSNNALQSQSIRESCLEALSREAESWQMRF